MSAAPIICLVEDDPIMGESLCDRFELEGFRHEWHKTAGSALGAIGQRPYAVVVSDVRLPDFGGDELYERLRAAHPALPPFVFVTGFGSIDRAVELLKHGAADYITKPFDIESLIEKVRALAAVMPRPAVPSTVRLGISPAMRRIEEMLPRVARRASTLLITGESGVGKERVAVVLHHLARES